ncbi:MAG: cyclic nucleotide-binding domain-containing protein [Myxococcota bacterium]|nr:cyclic nucleotide-binding domain-containing protein [Myxococcota bacterium]
MTVAEFLSNTTYFSNLSDGAIAELIARTEIMVLSNEEEVFAEGAPGDAWYLVISGEVVITRASDSRPPHVLGSLEPGEGFGEMALLDDSPRMGAATAQGSTTLLRLPREAFAELMEANHPGTTRLLKAMAMVLSQRLREVTWILQDLVDEPAPSTPVDPNGPMGRMLQAMVALN